MSICIATHLERIVLCASNLCGVTLCALNEQRLGEVKRIWSSNDSVHRGDWTRHWKTDTVSIGTIAIAYFISGIAFALESIGEIVALSI